jgi:hypothetical protein
LQTREYDISMSLAITTRRNQFAFLVLRTDIVRCLAEVSTCVSPHPIIEKMSARKIKIGTI